MAGFDQANGVWIAESQPFSGPLSLAVAGSFHNVCKRGIYNIWATQPWLFFETDGATDPPPVPTLQGDGTNQNYPGALIPPFAILQVQMDFFPVVFGGNPLVNPNGFRAVSLTGLAGTFYLSEFKVRSP